jgi:hypothetical protein
MNTVGDIRNSSCHCAGLKYDALIGQFQIAALLYMNYYYTIIIDEINKKN